MLWLHEATRARSLPAIWLIATTEHPRTRPERSALRHRISRDLIALQTGGPAADIRIAHEPSGRPVISAGRLDGLHLSHATRGGVVAVALARTAVGVDVEEIGAGPIPTQALHRAEQLWLAQLPESARAEAFATLWAAKEAYGKWAGTGLPDSDGFAVLPDGEGWRVTGARPAFVAARPVEIAGRRFAAAAAVDP